MPCFKQEDRVLTAAHIIAQIPSASCFFCLLDSWRVLMAGAATSAAFGAEVLFFHFFFPGGSLM